MKKTIFFALLLLAMVSCSQSEDFQSNTVTGLVSEPYSGTAHDIWTNILGSRFGGYTKGRVNTRAEGNFSITPYIVEGDTLMYIAQYENGWELYSASKATNMLICSSDDGVFDINDPNMPAALRALIEDECATIKQSLNKKIEKVDDSWSSSAILKNGFTNDIITYSKNGITKTLSESDLTPGHWVLIGTEKVGETEISSPRLTVTKWGQGAPWNTFTPKNIIIIISLFLLWQDVPRWQ